MSLAVMFTKPFDRYERRLVVSSSDGKVTSITGPQSRKQMQCKATNLVLIQSLLAEEHTKGGDIAMGRFDGMDIIGLQSSRLSYQCFKTTTLLIEWLDVVNRAGRSSAAIRNYWLFTKQRTKGQNIHMERTLRCERLAFERSISLFVTCLLGRGCLIFPFSWDLGKRIHGVVGTG